LVWAERCHVEFEQAAIRPQDIEDNGNDALKLLAERYAAIAQLIANGKYPPRHRVASTFPLSAHPNLRAMMTLQRRQGSRR